MNAPRTLIRTDSTFWRYSILAVCWTVLVSGSLIYNIDREQQESLNHAGVAARSNINKDIAFRKWASLHGGVYVSPTSHTPPNQYVNNHRLKAGGLL
jgi:hypothetical protein